MKYIFYILILGIICGLCFGFYIKPEDAKTGDLFIGLSIATLFFVLMPLFIYHRWKNKQVKDYMLTKENIEKMREYSENRNL